MKWADIHPVFREALGTHEAFRKLGFPAEDIFVHLNPDRTMLVVLKTQNKDFTVTVGSFNKSLTYPTWKMSWNAVGLAVIEGRVSEKDLERIWRSCYVYRQKVEFLMGISSKGIVIPGPAVRRGDSDWN